MQNNLPVVCKNMYSILSVEKWRKDEVSQLSIGLEGTGLSPLCCPFFSFLCFSSLGRKGEQEKGEPQYDGGTVVMYI